MSYDIYGNDLLAGHCEVHPNVPEPWPCSVCAYQAEEFRRYEEERQREYEEWLAEQENE